MVRQEPKGKAAIALRLENLRKTTGNHHISFNSLRKKLKIIDIPLYRQRIITNITEIPFVIALSTYIL